MTCNINRPYNSTHTSKTPTFSRLRKNLIFERGDKIEIFAFSKLRPIKAIWTLCHNMLNTEFLSGDGITEMDQSVRIDIDSTKLKPGFYDLHFTIFATNKVKTTGKTTFGYRINDLKITNSKPKDFSRFWKAALKKLDNITLAPSVEFVREMNDREISQYNIKHASLPEKLDPAGVKYKKIKLYRISFNSLGENGTKRYHGWYAVPSATGPHPGLLVLPGAGCDSLPAPVEHARHGFASLMLHIHGMKPDLKKYQRPRRYLKGPYDNNLTDDYYYYVYLACVQAVRFLESCDEISSDNISACGGSQGGLLTMVTAALCPQIKTAVASVCYYGYWPFRDEIGRLNSNKSNQLKKIPFRRNIERQNHLSYFDAMNFASMVKCPTLMSACLCDVTSPATSLWAIFNKLKSNKKKIIWSPGTDHDVINQFEKDGFDWINKDKEERKNE